MVWIVIAFVMAAIIIALLMILYGVVTEKTGPVLCGIIIVVAALFLFTIYEPSPKAQAPVLIYPHYEKN
ncbi:MAG: hypothetical protein MR717_09080 [Prevotella sp.]|nr:hypothetical protein [Prevotella sp.]